MTNRGGHESSTSIAQKLITFVRESKRNILLRRITKVMAVFVVFITTYMLILPAITETTNTLTIKDISYTEVVYSDSEYSTVMTLTFSGVTVSDVKTNNYTYTLWLPDGVEIDSSLLEGTRNGYDGSTLAFTYQYFYDDETGLYYAVLTFDGDYIASYTSDDAVLNDGYITFDTTFSSSAIQNDGSIKVSYNDTDTLEIPVDQITTTDGSYTPGADISVSKSSSTYDAVTNSITYTVTVYSLTGTTSEISLKDIISLTGSEFSIKDVLLDSVTYAEKTNEYNYGTSSAVDSSLYSYIYDSGSLTMTLPKLEATTYGSAYTITYTVYLDSFTDYTLTDTLNNSVTASAMDTWKGGTTIEDTDTTTTDISISLLSKTGSYNKSTGEITWTITINASGVDIYGMTLSDEMFEGLTENDVTITSSGYGSQGNGYSFSEDSNGNLIITFGAVNGVNTNTDTYTITYTTGAGNTLGSGSNYNKTNEASLVDSGDNEVASGEYSVYVSGGGSASKSLSDSTANTDGTVTTEWRVTFNIPSGGITSGTVLYDCLSDYWSYETVTDQYFTYNQAMSIYGTYGYSLTIADSNGSTIKSLDSGSGDFTMQFYDITAGTWVSVSDLQNGYSTYSTHKFTAFSITFDSDITLSSAGTLTLQYSSTVDVSGASTDSDTYYYNRVYVNNSQFAEASYKNSASVVKMNDNGSSSDTSATTTTGQIAWKVKVYVEEGATDTFTITDTLPEGVTLSAVYISTSDYYSDAMTIADNGDGTYSISGTLNSSEVTGTITTNSDGQQVIKLIVDSDDYASLSSASDGGYIWIRYVTQMSDDLMTIAAGETYVTNALTNEVSVTKGTSAYGTDSQTQTVTYGESGSDTGSESLEKGYTWDKYNSEITYSIVVNPDAEDLLTGSDTLELVDVVSANFMEGWGLYLSLLTNSVHVYEAVLVTDEIDTTNLTVYTGGNGKSYVAGNEVTVENLTYSQSTSWNSETAGTTEHTINATVPDETALIITYSYYVNMEDENSNGILQSLYNTVTLKGDSEIKDGTSTKEEYIDDNSSAGIFGNESLTLTKVNSTNLNRTLSGAVYKLYWYQNGEWTDTGLTYTTNSGGTFTITKTILQNAGYYAVNTAYKLIEIDAPDGYILDNATEWAFYWYDKDTNTSSYPDGFTTQDNVYNLSVVSAQIIAPNVEAEETKTSVSVEKEWVDTAGTAITTDLPDTIAVSLYRYEESDVADSDDDDPGSAGGADTVDVYLQYAGSVSSTPVATVNKGEDVTLVVDIGGTDTISSWALYYTSSWSQVSYNYSVNSASCEIDISSAYTTDVLYLSVSGTASTWAGTVTVKGESASVSGVNSSGLPHDSYGNYAGTKIGEYTITADSNGKWSYTVEDLVYEYYDNTGVKHTYYYYFVEEAVDGYYTTYSSSEGVTDGGSLTITNTQLPTTEISVEKQWLDTNGDELESGDEGYQSITVDLYRTEVAESGGSSSGTETVTLKIGEAYWSGGASSYTEYSILKGETVTISFNASWSGNVTGWLNNVDTNFGDTQGSYTFTINEDTVIVLSGNGSTYTALAVTYASQGAASSGTTYTGAEIPTDGTYIGTYTIDKNSNWSYTFSDLPGGYVDENGTLHYYYYYVRESSENLVKFDTTYSTSSAVSDGDTITIYNTYNPNLTYTEAEIKKVWEDNDGNEITDLDSYSATFQLWQVLKDTSTDSGYVEVDDGTGNTSVLMIPYRSPMTLTSSSTSWEVLWVNLPTKATYGGTSYDCIYFITETDATDGTTTTTFTISAGVSTESGANTYTITVDGVTYYAVTVGDTSSNNSPSEAPVVTITNVSSDDTISITVEKTWVKNGAAFDMTNATVTVQLLQVLTADGYDPRYNESSASDIEYTKTIIFTGSSTEEVKWTGLPKTLEVNSVTYTCAYYIVEVSVVNGSGTPILDEYSVSYTIDGSEATLYPYTDSGTGDITNYYAVSNGKTITITNTASDSIVLPVTGGSGIRNLILMTGSTLMLFAIAVILARQRRIRRWSS